MYYLSVGQQGVLMRTPRSLSTPYRLVVSEYKVPKVFVRCKVSKFFWEPCVRFSPRSNSNHRLLFTIKIGGDMDHMSDFGDMGTSTNNCMSTVQLSTTRSGNNIIFILIRLKTRYFVVCFVFQVEACGPVEKNQIRIIFNEEGLSLLWVISWLPHQLSRKGAVQVIGT